METIYLAGAEDIQRAGNRMIAAADQMQRAASSIEDTLSRALNRFEELVSRLEALQEKQ